jgi:glyoxylase-like metal-dependent hydrolase (beta-lactamase superfamily II)
VADAELQPISSELFIWQAFDASVKADLFSTGFAADAGFYLVDPIEIGADIIAATVGASSVAGVVVTNANHARASAAFAARFEVAVYVHPAARDQINYANCIEIGRPAAAVAGAQIVTIDGAAPGEIALFLDGSGGTVIFGDAVINAGSYGFTLLPAKYCVSARQMRKSLRKLLDLQFERMLFAHGTPIMSNARTRLAALLDES